MGFWLGRRLKTTTKNNLQCCKVTSGGLQWMNIQVAPPTKWSKNLTRINQSPEWTPTQEYPPSECYITSVYIVFHFFKHFFPPNTASFITSSCYTTTADSPLPPAFSHQNSVFYGFPTSVAVVSNLQKHRRPKDPFPHLLLLPQTSPIPHVINCCKSSKMQPVENLNTTQNVATSYWWCHRNYAFISQCSTVWSHITQLITLYSAHTFTLATDSSHVLSYVYRSVSHEMVLLKPTLQLTTSPYICHEANMVKNPV